jgi:hypothetical protein
MGKRVMTVMLIILGVVVLWFWTTQPVFEKSFHLGEDGLIDPAKLEKHVRVLAEDLIPRHSEYPDNLEKAADYIRGEFEKTEGNIREFPYEINGRIYRIVSLLFGPETGERIVVGAHYDAPPGSPGANDNASGVAGLLELAHAFSISSPSTAVELVAYPVEEPPYYRTKAMASYVHADQLKKNGIKVRFMIALEMIGYYNDGSFSQSYPFPLFRLTYPSKGNFIAVIGRMRDGFLVRRFKNAMRGASRVPVYSFNGPSIVPGVDLSDHLNYWKKGFKALMITDTAFYRYDHYHGAGDVPDNLDYERMAEVVTGIHGALMQLDR